MDNEEIVKIYKKQVDDLASAKINLLRTKSKSEKEKLDALISQIHYNLILLQEKYGRNGLFSNIRIK